MTHLCTRQSPMLTPGGCTWSQADNKFRGSYAGGDSRSFTLADAKQACIDKGSGVCTGVTCASGGSCTLRASADLGDSTTGETTYSPNSACFESGTKCQIPHGCRPEYRCPCIPQRKRRPCPPTVPMISCACTKLLSALAADATTAAATEPIGMLTLSFIREVAPVEACWLSCWRLTLNPGIVEHVRIIWLWLPIA